jgi:hypothetical protein
VWSRHLYPFGNFLSWVVNVSTFQCICFVSAMQMQKSARFCGRPPDSLAATLKTWTIYNNLTLPPRERRKWEKKAVRRKFCHGRNASCLGNEKQEFRIDLKKDCFFNKKKRKTLFTRTLFSELIKDMDHHKCGWRGGSKSDKTSLWFTRKKMSVKKVFFLMNKRFYFFKGFFYCFCERAHVNADLYLYETSKVTTNYVMA